MSNHRVPIYISGIGNHNRVMLCNWFPSVKTLPTYRWFTRPVRAVVQTSAAAEVERERERERRRRLIPHCGTCQDFKGSCSIHLKHMARHEWLLKLSLDTFKIIRGGILAIRCGEILLISSSTLPGVGRVSTKNVNKLKDFNAAVSRPENNTCMLVQNVCVQTSKVPESSYYCLRSMQLRVAARGALHKIGRFRNVPTVGTFINKLKLNLLTNVPMVGTFRKRPILCNAPQVQYECGTPGKEIQWCSECL